MREQSKSKYDMRVLPPNAVLRVTAILTKGAKKYGMFAWRRYGKLVHVARATAHLILWAAGDRAEDNLGNAVCRLLFAIEEEETDAEGRADCAEKPVPSEEGLRAEGVLGG
jgi:hypothetical protein